MSALDPTTVSAVYAQTEKGWQSGPIGAAYDSAGNWAEERDAVSTFIAKRPEYVQALKSSPNADADYWRWQGHAEARRQLCAEVGGNCRCGYHPDRVVPTADDSIKRRFVAELRDRADRADEPDRLRAFDWLVQEYPDAVREALDETGADQ